MIKTEGAAVFLKENTRSEHDAVEAHVGANAIFGGNFTKQQYITLLQKLLTAHISLEPEILENRSVQNEQQLNPERRLSKASLIKQDLKALHADDSVPQKINISLNNDAESWGAYYVLEGSSLGGAVILKQLKKLDWAKDVDAFNFYGCYGAQTGPNWKQFLEALESHDFEYEKLLTGANKAYRVFMDS